MIGIDTVRISRIKDALNSDGFKNRVFTVREIEYCESRPNPIESFAGLFCAKEAAVKAVKTGFGRGIMPGDIEISHDGNGAPILIAHGGAVDVFAGCKANVSVSHDGDYAVAAVLLTNGGSEL